MSPQAHRPDAREVAGWLHAALRTGAALVADSRAVGRGDAFFAFPGERTDGRRYIEDAITAGAAAVLWEGAGYEWPDRFRVPNLGLLGLRAATGPIADAYFGHPSRRLEVLAVTGTNGKTSCTQWIAQALESLGARCAVVGTLGAGRPGALEPFGLTTPDALSLQALFARYAEASIGHVAIEASSIGIDQDRLAGTRLHTAVFTNLTRDHLDYHRTMQAYAQAKARLFSHPGLACAIVNLEDDAATQMLASARDAGTRIGYALRAAEGSLPPAAGSIRVDACLIGDAQPLAAGQRLSIDGDFGRAEVELRLLGRFNAANVLAVAAACLAQGHPLARVAAALEHLLPVPGRMQTLGAPGEPLVVIDYAHSPAALEQVLAALRPIAARRGGALWCLFGAGGDRDRGKRAQMGAAAEAAADRVVITSDNPRSESPGAIAQEIAAGMRGAPAWIDADRARAIARAIGEAANADVLLLAGKGHETYQEVGDVRLPFSDHAVAAAALGARAERADV